MLTQTIRCLSLGCLLALNPWSHSPVAIAKPAGEVKASGGSGGGSQAAKSSEGSLGTPAKAAPAAQPRPAAAGRAAAAAPASADNPASAPPRPSSKAKGDISFDDLKFDMEIGGTYDPSLLTEAIRALDGKVVKLRGFILPSTLFRETNIDEFVLVRDNQECCFGPGAALFDCVVVNLIGGVKTDFTTRPVTVTGTFRLKEYKYPDDSGHFAIFNLLGTSVK